MVNWSSDVCSSDLMNLINIRRVAWGVRELEELRDGNAPAAGAGPDGRAAGYDGASGGSWADRQGGAVSANRSDRHSSVSTGELTREAVEQITKQVIARLMATK